MKCGCTGMSSDRANKPSRPISSRATRDPGQPLNTSTERVEPLALKEALLAIFRSARYKPPVLPAVALELIHLTRKSNASYEEVVHVLEKDPLLVANILKLAQSPLYGARRAQSLQAALSRVGMSSLRDMVWQVVLGLRIFRADAYASTLERIQSHSTFVAYAAKAVAAEAGIAAEHAFLCGLLHDVGWSGALVTASETMPSPPLPETLFAALDNMHAEAGQAMAHIWGLSEEIIEVIAQHHEGGRPGHQVPALVPVLCVAEQLAEECDFAIAQKNASPPAAMHVDENLVGRYEHAVASLGLERKLERIRQRTGDIADQLRGASSS